MADAPFTEVFSGNIAADASRVFVSSDFFEIVGLFPVAPTPIDPIVAVVSPTSGGQLQASESLVVDVTDESDELREVVLLVRLQAIGIYEVAYDGRGFGPNYAANQNSRSTISGGFRFTLRRRGDWPAGGVTLRAIATDSTGGAA